MDEIYLISNAIVIEFLSNLIYGPPPHGNNTDWVILLAGFICGSICAAIAFFLEHKRNKYWFSMTALSFAMGFISFPIVFLYLGLTEFAHRLMSNFPTEDD